MNSFDNNLKRLRISRNMKQEELAERMNVTRQTISGWETGRRQPDLDTLKQLAEVLDADIHELIYGNKPGEYPKYQKKYVIRTALLGGIVTVLVLFWLLIWPYFKVVCATNHWGTPLLICHQVLPFLGCFAGGALIPAVAQLFVPVRLGNRWVGWCLIAGVIAVLPYTLFWLGVYSVRRWMLYSVGHAVITYILPFAAGISVMLGVTGGHV